MNYKQAAQLHKHLMDAADALDQASEVIFELPKKDRASLAAQFGQLVVHVALRDYAAILCSSSELRPSGSGRS